MNEFQKVFSKKYARGGWDGKGSGAGSSLSANKKYITFLEKHLFDYGIKSVIDYGCGDWQFSQHVKWGDIDYLGLDVVESVIDTNKEQFPVHNFVSDSDVFPYLKGRDIIIIKDVLMHWPDEEIIPFLDRLVKKDIWVLLVNAATRQPPTRKIGIGGFAHLEYDKFPLNKYNPELLFKFGNRQVVRLDRWQGIPTSSR